MVKSLNYPIIAILVTTFVAMVYSIAPGIAFYGVSRKYDGFLCLTVFVFLFYIIQMAVKRKDIEKFVIAFISIAFVVCVYALCQKFRLDPYEGMIGPDNDAGLMYVASPGSTFGRSCFLAGFLVVIPPLALYMVLKSQDWRRWMYVVMLGMVLYVIVLTKSRAGLLGMVVSLACFVIGCRHYISFKLVGIILGLVIALNVFIPGSPGKRLVASSVDARLEIWHLGWQMIKDRPWVGYGQDCLRLIYGGYYMQEYGRAPGAGEQQKSLHNEMLDILVDTGVVGLAPWIFFYVQYFWMVWRGMRCMITLALGSSVLGYFVQNQFSYGTTPNMLVFWYLVALTVVSVRK